MESLRSRLEALLEKDLFSNTNNFLTSNSPMLNQDLDLFYIETPAKLKDSTPSCCYNIPVPVNSRDNPYNKIEQQTSSFNQSNAHSSYNFSRCPLEKKTATSNFGYFFADPTPLRFISDSPLVTPLRLLP